jgi:PLP dependent protein
VNRNFTAAWREIGTKDDMSVIRDNLERVHDRIRNAARACGRRPEDIILVAVSKNFPVERISEAIAAGQLHFGENRVQEAEMKLPALAGYPGLTWHMIGHLQSNKAPKAVRMFDMIHSVDSIKLAQKLDQSAREAGRVLPILVQIDLGHEETKFGANETRAVEVVGVIAGMAGLKIDGLMTIPPYFDEPEETRPYFARLRQILETLEQEQPGRLGRKLLSMGMSHDFEIAIQEGAHLVRVGTAIFGTRAY